VTKTEQRINVSNKLIKKEEMIEKLTLEREKVEYCNLYPF
jgi:hypothetical protein